MPQPPRPVISTSFADEEATLTSGRSTVRTSALDASLASIVASLSAVLDNLFLLQRDDGKVRDGVIAIHTLAADVLALLASGSFNVRGPWETGTAYAKGDLASESDVAHLCFVAHTSGDFATDLAAGYWVAIPASPSAVNIVFSPTATISATNAQAAIEELDTEIRSFQNLYADQLMGGL